METIRHIKDIQLSSHCLYIGKYLISFHGKRRSLQLLHSLMENKDGIYHEDLRLAMFGRLSTNKKIIKTQDMSLIKLISRTRKIVTTALANTEWTEDVQWFIYRDRDDTWKLVQFH